MNYWYSAQPDEIFLDLDSNRATARALSVLRLAIRKRELPIRGVWLYSTLKKGHAHMIIGLKDAMPIHTRLAWSLWLGNDRLRVSYILERYERGIYNCDLLMAKRTTYHRPANAYCQCTKKHKKKNVTDKCDAMKHLLGDQRSADYFTRTGSAPPRRRIRVPWGQVSLTQLRHWEAVYE